MPGAQYLNIEKDVLRILMMVRGYVSEAKLAQQLGILKSTVNRVMKELMAKGFVIDFHPELGYRLADLDNLDQAYKYVNYLDTEIKFYINYVEVCDSTQDIALALAKKGAPEGIVILAEELRRGRGRMGRQWVATKGGLWLSIILRPRELKHVHLLSLATATALAEAINSILGVDARVKWPNDVLINEKKVAGILIEGSVEANIVQYVVVGIGVNVNNVLPQELRSTATTLKDTMGVEVPRIPLLLNMLKNLDNAYGLLKQNQTAEILRRWRKLSSTLNRYVKVITMNGEFEGMAENVEEDGALIIRTLDDNKVKIYTGDVIHLREQRP